MPVYTFEEFMERLNKVNVKDTTRWSILLWKLIVKQREDDEGIPFNSEDKNDYLNKYKYKYYT
jgi:hypothetical protein